MSTHLGQETRESLHELVNALQRDRQRLRIQINLGRRELADEWDRMERKWSEVEHHLNELTDESMRQAHNLGNQIAGAYYRLKSRAGLEQD